MNAILIIFAVVVGFLLLELIYWGLILPKASRPNKSNKMMHYYEKDLRAYAMTYKHIMGLNKHGYEKKIDDQFIYDAIKMESDFIKHRFDCSDFRLQLMIRLYLDCQDKLETRTLELIKETFLGFKYFMDEKGSDSMCYWSENHQILFAVSEYLAGQTWEKEVFSNSGMTGKEHMEKAKVRIYAWMEQRFKFGFSEYYSNTYLLEDISPMANFIEYSKDEVMVSKMRIIMDLLWYDVATHSVKNRFIPVSSRMYANNKRGNCRCNSILACMNVIWGDEMQKRLLSDPNLDAKERELIMTSLDTPFSDMALNFAMIYSRGLYKVPEAIREIAMSEEPVVIKASSGLSPQDMKEQNLIGQEPHQIMAQWGAETFTNPEVVENTIKYLKNNKMFRNNFLYYFKFFNTTIFKMINLKKFTQKFWLRTHGIALNRGNVYGYRTKDYMLTTAVANSVDDCGAQEHIWTANLGENLTVFTTHPSRNDNVFDSSAGYWIGNGRRPMSVQKENVNITIYRIPQKKRVFEIKTSNVTHAYMPKNSYDEFELLGSRVYARKGNIYVAMIANGDLKFKPYNEKSLNPLYKPNFVSQSPELLRITGEFDLVREGGMYHSYITELSSSEKETFAEFKDRISQTKVEFVGDKVVYSYEGSTLSVNYKGEFLDNATKVDYNYDRFDSIYCNAKRKDEEIIIKFGKKSVALNYKEGTRTIVD